MVLPPPLGTYPSEQSSISFATFGYFALTEHRPVLPFFNGCIKGTKMNVLRRGVVGGAVVAVCLSFGGGAAWAQTAGTGSYTGVTPPQLAPVQVSANVASLQQAAPVSQSSTLPFTGSDAVQLAGFGLALVGAGVTLNRLSRRRRTS